MAYAPSSRISQARLLAVAGRPGSDLALRDAMLVDHLANGARCRAGHAARTSIGPGGALQRAVITGHGIRCAAADGKQEYRDFLVHACLHS